MTGELANITCTFAFPTFHNAENQWCCYKYRDRETDKEFVAIGINLPKVRDLPVQLVGHWATNKKTGKKQFEVQYVEQARLTTKSEVIAYFVSLKCGIGKAKAAAIYRKFGDRTWDVLDREPEELKKVSGISEKVYNRMIEAVKASNVSRELLRLFARAGITVSGNTLHSIIEKLGQSAADSIRANPYIAYGIDGFAFDKCEAIAACLHLPADSDFRIKAFAKKVLIDAGFSGHVCLPKDIYLAEVQKQSGCTREKCAAAINELYAARKLRGGNGHLYLPAEFVQEETICRCISELLISGTGPVTGVEPIIDRYEREQHIKLAQSQREAVVKAFSSQVSIITGGPGVGKTTVTKAILYVHKAVYGESSDPRLLAPTGKAARRMSEATCYPAATIHSAVGWRGDDVDIPCDDATLVGNLIMVDEASMMDQKICSILLERIQVGARVIFIGDIDQLPSVGSGNVLHDLIASGVIPTTRLTVIFRQAGDNPIVYNCHRINEGKTDLIYGKTFKFLETQSEGEAFVTACRMYVKCVRAYGVENVILLNPQRNNTDLSVDNFNVELQKVLNPPDPAKLEMKVGRFVFRAGDRVMELKNTPEAKNGDVGTIRDITRKPDPDDPTEWIYTAHLEFNGDGKILDYDSNDLRHITHAWCTTVHKVQGSEYPTVIEVVSKAHPSLLKKRLVYTGISRAKVNVAIVGERDALEIAVNAGAETDEQRYTLLTERLQTAAAKRSL